MPIRIAACFVAFVAIVLLLLPWAASQLDRHVAALSLDLPLAARIAGGVILTVAFVAYTACSYHLTTRGRGAYIEFDPPSQFVASGPFRWCRNPIAACAVVAVLGEGLMFSSGGILLLAVGGVLIAHIQVVVIEEPLLRKRFGQTYEDYLARVPRWIPRRPRESPS